MLKIVVKIGKIDNDGYFGRDNLHPKEEDSWKEAELIGIELQRENPLPINDVDFVRVRMKDGRIVELVEHEIQAIFGWCIHDE